MPVYGLLRDPPPHDFSFETIILGNPAYATGTFFAYVDMSKDYSTWFAKSFEGPIIGDVTVSGGKVLGGIVRA